ncbi:MAG TPA: spermidine synthase [Afipia sp.]
MIPWKLIDTGPIPGTSDTLKLKQRGDEFSIMLGQNQLMSSRLYGSEIALATLTHRRIADRKNANILIGGLGMGFTLRAALEVFGPATKIVVAELVPAVIAWARGPMAAMFGNSLSDPRLTIERADVVDVIRAKASAYDAILLDVDNGPEGLTRAANDRLYELGGLKTTFRALRPAGILAVWSSRPDDGFTQRLQHAGFLVDEIAVRASDTRKGSRHHIWLAARPESDSRGKSK